MGKDRYGSIKRGEFVIIRGPSGGGKTTFLNILGTIDSSTHGYLRNKMNKHRNLRKINKFYNKWWLIEQIEKVKNRNRISNFQLTRFDVSLWKYWTTHENTRKNEIERYEIKNKNALKKSRVIIKSGSST